MINSRKKSILCESFVVQFPFPGFYFGSECLFIFENMGLSACICQQIEGNDFCLYKTGRLFVLCVSRNFSDQYMTLQ